MTLVPTAFLTTSRKKSFEQAESGGTTWGDAGRVSDPLPPDRGPLRNRHLLDDLDAEALERGNVGPGIGE